MPAPKAKARKPELQQEPPAKENATLTADQLCSHHACPVCWGQLRIEGVPYQRDHLHAVEDEWVTRGIIH
jgi:hypothetical protein